MGARAQHQAHLRCRPALTTRGAHQPFEGIGRAGLPASSTTTSASSGRFIDVIPIVRIPPRRPASTPAGASSTTTQRAGSTPELLGRDAGTRRERACRAPLPRRTPTTAAARGAEHVDDGLDVCRRRRRGDCLPPAGVMQALRATRGRPAAARCRSPRTMSRYAASFSSPMPRHFRMADRIAEESPQDRVVPLPEQRRELLVRQRVPLLRERVAPGEPVILGRVDERAVHVPQDSAGIDLS